MSKIIISGMEFFAYHGHYDEEKIAGNKFSIDLTMWTNTKKAEISDDLDDTLNYQIAYAIVKDIMTQTKSNLIENIAHNIITSLFEEFVALKKVKIYIKKLNPPMGGEIGSVGIIIKEKNTNK
ncbi:MAG: dihydroneopterin aldolase [Bacteroidales bacterium]|jgi:dihydroneopterin aldolase|nr:dihydroneopterin aldolase [Bacteroidales bacterium]